MRKEKERIGFCRSCQWNTVHLRRRKGYNPVWSLITFGILKPRTWKCNHCGYRVWFVHREEESAPTAQPSRHFKRKQSDKESSEKELSGE